MPKVNAESDTLFHNIGEVVGSSLTEQDIKELECNGGKYYTTLFEKILINIYLVLIDAHTIKLSKVDGKLEAAISLYKVNEEILHVVSIEFLKEYLYKVSNVVVDEKKTFVRQIKRRRTLNIGGANFTKDPDSTYYYAKTKISEATSQILLRLYCLAEVAAYNYTYYQKYNTFFEYGMKFKKIEKKTYIFDLLTTTPDSHVANYVCGRRNKHEDSFVWARDGSDETDTTDESANDSSSSDSD